MFRTSFVVFSRCGENVKMNLLKEKRSTFSFDSNIFIDKAQFNQVLIKKCQFIL